MVRKKKKPKPYWKHDIYKNVKLQIDSYNFSENEKDEIRDILRAILKDPTGDRAKKLRGFNNFYSARYVRIVFVKDNGDVVRKNKHYRFIYKVYPKRRLVVVTKFGDRESIYQNISEQFDWNNEYIYGLYTDEQILRED